LEQDQLIRSIFDTKASCIFKNAKSKVRHGQDKGIWIPPIVRATLVQHWSFIEFQTPRVLLPRRIGLLRREPQPTVVVSFLPRLILRKW